MDRLTEEEILQAHAVSAISNTMFVWHNEEGTITGISNYPSDGSYLEVSKDRLVDFLSGKKDYCRYHIDYFKFDEALRIKDGSIEISSALIYEIPKITEVGDTECTIIHDINNKRWKLLLSDSAKQVITQINPDTLFYFHLTSIKDPHYLYRTMKVSASAMMSGATTSFKTDFENTLSNFSVATFGYFKSYGILEV
jgi:Uri superfamily endonuclease